MIIAATGVQRALLQEEFASLTFVDLPGYRIKYGKNRAITLLRLIASIPKILIRIKQERGWLRGFAAREGLDLVISDNRYGLTLPGVYCIFITHQLLIRTPFGRWTDLLLQRMNYRLIRPFSRCWVPDLAGPEALAGILSGPPRKPAIPFRYIGWLSRFTTGEAAAKEPDSPAGADVAAGIGVAADTTALILLSGPEPQRSLLERLILRQAARSSSRIVLVRGLPGGGRPLTEVPSSMTVHDHLPAKELARIMRGARLVIARSGYSTVMDLARMGKRAVLIPTPGQTEQEYLGRYLAEKGWAVCMQQTDFSLEKALAIAGSPPCWPAAGLPDRLRDEVSAVLALVAADRDRY